MTGIFKQVKADPSAPGEASSAEFEGEILPYIILTINRIYSINCRIIKKGARKLAPFLL